MIPFEAKDACHDARIRRHLRGGSRHAGVLGTSGGARCRR
jgi:hypothetical protein